MLITGRVKRAASSGEEKAPGRAQSPSQAVFPCGQMTAQKAKAGGVKQHRNGHGAFVPSGSCHANLDSMDRSVPELVEQLGNLPGAWPRQLWEGGRETLFSQPQGCFLQLLQPQSSSTKVRAQLSQLCASHEAFGSSAPRTSPSACPEGRTAPWEPHRFVCLALSLFCPCLARVRVSFSVTVELPVPSVPRGSLCPGVCPCSFSVPVCVLSSQHPWGFFVFSFWGFFPFHPAP